MLRRVPGVVVLVALGIGVGTAHADDGKREAPDYDGRGNQDADDSWTLWIPRVVLSPLYFVNEFLLRRPLGALVARAERDHWASTIGELFTFGPNDEDEITPTALVDFGLRPSVGIYVALNNIFTPDNEMRFSAATGGPEWLTATALDRYSWDHHATTVSARFDYIRRPDYLFLGTGPDVTDATRARYGLSRIEASAGLAHRLTGETHFTFTAGVRETAFRPGNYCCDPSLDARIADGSLAMPYGYNTPYTVVFNHTELMLDSREARPGSSTGLYLRLNGGTTTDVANPRTWLTYGATAGASVDLDSHHRTLSLQTGVELVDPLQGNGVPFNELAQLGSNQMAGFVLGWMNGRSTFVTQVDYRWPVWMWLDGQLRVAAGNAFDQHLDGLALEKLRLSADVGITSIGAHDTQFEMLFGLGSETIQQGARITSARISIGSRKGF